MINKMNLERKEAIKLIENTKSVPALTRSFIFWLYRNGYKIADIQTGMRRKDEGD